MPLLTDDKLNKAIKSDELASFYLLYGEEVHLLQNTLSALLKKAVDPALEQFNLQRFDGEKMTINELQTAYDALPMMSPQKCITVKDWNLDKLNKADTDLLQEMIASPNPSSVLILFYTSPSIDVKKGAKAKKIYSLIEKNGITCEFALKDKATLRKALTARSQKAGVLLSPALCDSLIDRCGAQYSILLNEVDKLIAHAGNGGEITAKMIQQLCIESIQSTAFDLSNAILQNQFDRAFGILNRLFYLRIDPIMIMGALNMSFVDLYRVKSAQLIGLSSDRVIQDFQYRSKYRITKLYKDVQRFSIEQVRGCIACLEKSDRLLKSSKLDSRLVLEQMLGEMCLCNRK